MCSPVTWATLLREAAASACHVGGLLCQVGCAQKRGTGDAMLHFHSYIHLQSEKKIWFSFMITMLLRWMYLPLSCYPDFLLTSNTPPEPCRRCPRANRSPRRNRKNRPRRDWQSHSLNAVLGWKYGLDMIGLSAQKESLERCLGLCFYNFYTMLIAM